MISCARKFVFVHIPRTGGTSIGKVLSRYCEWPAEASPGVHLHHHKSRAYEKHATIEAVSKELDVSQYFKFGVVRNPWDRVLSLYLWGIQIQPIRKWKAAGDFNEWLQTIFTDKKQSAIYWKNQRDYLSIKGKIAVDYIMGFETLEREWGSVCRYLNIHEKLPQVYSTTHKPYTTYYDKKSIALIAKMFARDISEFKY